MVDGKRGRPAMSEADKAAAKAARDAMTPEEKRAAKDARAAKKASKAEEADTPAPKVDKPSKAASEPRQAKPKTEAPKRATREEPIVMDPHLLTNDQREGVFLENLRKYDTTEADVKKIIADAKAKLASVRDHAKAAYGKDFLADRAIHKRLSQPDGRAILESIFTSHAFVARVADIHLSRDVMDLFGEDRTPHNDKMFRDGKKAAMSGLGPTPPGNLNGPSQSKWTEGYHAGTAERERMEASFTAQKTAPSEFAKHAPKQEEPALPLDDRKDGYLRLARDAGAEAFELKITAIPPNNLNDDEHAAWIEGYNAARDAKPAEVVALDWQKQGELAFANGEGNSPPDAVPLNERGSWRAGWNRASTAHLEAKRAAAKKPKVEATAPVDEAEDSSDDAFAAGVQHRTRGGGCSIPENLDGEDRDQWHAGWSRQDQAMQAERGSSH